jgi:hypothetical protein
MLPLCNCTKSGVVAAKRQRTMIVVCRHLRFFCLAIMWKLKLCFFAFRNCSLDDLQPLSVSNASGRKLKHSIVTLPDEHTLTASTCCSLSWEYPSMEAAWEIALSTCLEVSSEDEDTVLPSSIRRFHTSNHTLLHIIIINVCTWVYIRRASHTCHMTAALW